MGQQARPGVDLSKDRTGSIINSVIICMVLSGLSVIARFTSRYLKKTSLAISDWLVLGGLAGAWVMSLIIIEAAKRGLGKHVEVVGPAGVRELLLLSYIGEIFYSISFPLVKISILSFYREIFASRFMAIATTGISIFVVMWGIALLLVTIFSCEPIHGHWDITIKAKCVDAMTFFWGNSIPNILADILILSLPVKEVLHLQMSRNDKTLVCGMFLMGGFVIIASGLRIYFMLDMDLMDMTWTYQGVGLWTAVELDVAVISACLPLIRPTLEFLIPSSIMSYVSKSSSIQDTRKKTGDSPKATVSRQNLSKEDDYERLVEYPMQTLISSTSRV